MDESDTAEFTPGQRVHSLGDPRRVGTVQYWGPVEGYPGTWVGVDWDNGKGKHDGSVNGVRYFPAKSQTSGSFVRPKNLSPGLTLLDGLVLRYQVDSTKEEEDEMYVLSASNKRVFIQLLGKDKIQDKLSRFEELRVASLSYSGVSFLGSSCKISSILPNLKELDLTGNLFSEWRDVGAICKELPALSSLNLSNNAMAHDISDLSPLNNIRVLVLNNTGITWTHVEILKQSLPVIEELHLMGNKISQITPVSSETVHGFNLLRILNLGDNCIASWDEILKLSQLQSLEQLHLNKNRLNGTHYPNNDTLDRYLQGYDSLKIGSRPFQNLYCLLLGCNNIVDLTNIDSLNSFPHLIDIRLSDNPVADPGKGGVPRFVLIARLAKVEMLNGSEVSARERKDSEIRYVRLVMSKLHDNSEEIKKLHPRFFELMAFHGIEERPTNRASGLQKMSSGLVSINLQCVGPSIGERTILTKKLPATTTVGKLKKLCQSFFKLQSVNPKLFLQELGSPLPLLLEEDMASLVDLGIVSGSTVIVDEES